MAHPSGLDLIYIYLISCLPQEWLISKSNHTTCEETDEFLRIDSEIKPESGRELVCLIQIKPNEIVIRTPNLLTKTVQKVVQHVKLYSTNVGDYCLTLTECPLYCEKCHQAWPKFHE